MDSTGNKPTTDREKSLEWFFALNDVEKMDLKTKYFPNTFIQCYNHWGYAYTFGQIEEMYNLEQKNKR